jgi:hypothetical protein
LEKQAIDRPGACVVQMISKRDREKTPTLKKNNTSCTKFAKFTFLLLDGQFTVALQERRATARGLDQMH